MTEQDKQPPRTAESEAADERERRKRSGRSAAAARIADQATYVDEQIRLAMAKGDFEDLPGAGKPIQGLGASHDPDWWLKKLVEREQITMLPLSVELRREDGELDGRLDRLTTEDQVRRVIADFNQRVVAARYRAPEGPPLITMPRDAEADVAAWRERRTARLAEQKRRLAETAAPARARRRWWRRRS